MDSDQDGKLNLEEFVDHVYAFYKAYAEFENGGAAALGPEEKFNELDVNKDKFEFLKKLFLLFYRSFLQPSAAVNYIS